jgi:hypothetical protein
VGETTTIAPLVVKNLVIVGDSGGELGVRGKVVALDVGTGKEVWWAYMAELESLALDRHRN